MNDRLPRLIRPIYAICLVAGTSTHAMTLFQHGLFWDYGGVPWPSAVYWTALTFLDPLAVALLFLSPSAGLIATAAIITTDVVHNSWINWRFAIGLNFPLASQVAFFVFVLVTFRIAWRHRSGLGDTTSGPILSK